MSASLFGSRRHVGAIMAGDTVIDAKAALGVVVKKYYSHKITEGDWAKMSPADNPPDGFASFNTSDWLKALDRSSALMQKAGHAMATIQRPEAEKARTGKLEDSLALLVSKASARTLAPPATVPTGVIVGGAAFGLTSMAVTEPSGWSIDRAGHRRRDRRGGPTSGPPQPDRARGRRRHSTPSPAADR